MDDSLVVNDVSIAHGQLQIILKSELYSFTGKYLLTDDDTTVLSRNGLQFDYLILVNGHNLAIYQKDLHKIEGLIHSDALQRYVKFEVRLVTAEGWIKMLTAEGKIFDVYKKTAAEWRRSEQELKSANDLLQTVFDASPHAISVYRILHNRKGEPEDFEILSLNTPTVLTIGMRVDEVVGKRFGKLFPYMKQNGVYDHYLQVAATGARADFEVSFDDHGTLLLLRFIVVRTNNLLVATIENVTSRMEAADNLELLQQRTTDLVRSRHGLVLLNESLNKKNRELRIMNEELTNFTFIASHDLREPLRKIQFFCSQLAHPQAALVSPEGRALIDKIQNSTQWLNDLIDNILTFSQTASAPRTTRIRINLNNLVQQVLGELSELIVQTQTHIEAAPLAELWGNPIQLSQLLYNLISNAIKFQPPDHTPIVNISGSTVASAQVGSDLAHPNTHYYCLEVTDNGIGFEPQYTDRIFRIFQRLHSKEAYPGTGMGLAICKKIVENHNGFILAKSTPGVGSVFRCYFPV